MRSKLHCSIKRLVNILVIENAVCHKADKLLMVVSKFITHLG